MCEECSLVYINPRLSAGDYKHLYHNDYQADRHGVFGYEQAIKRLLEKDSYNNKKALLSNFTNYINKDSHVLEIGSGWGTLLKVIQDNFQCYVVGIEISEIAAMVGKKHYGLNIYNQTLEDYLTGSNAHQKFNFVILNHVLEHFLDPYLRLIDIKEKLLDESGFLYIAVPNIASPDESPDRFFHIEHCYYFSPLTIRKLLQKAGLKIVDVKIGSHEAIYIVTKSDHYLLSINTDTFDLIYSQVNILRSLKKHDRKYKILRYVKNAVYAFLNKEMQIKASRAVSYILRKLQIIKI